MTFRKLTSMLSLVKNTRYIPVTPRDRKRRSEQSVIE
jgi:hypothetical protein